MSVIREDDVIANVADALQYISYYHTPDYIRAMGRAYAIEQSPAAREAIAQILTNSRLCAEGHRPIRLRTGYWTWCRRWAPGGARCTSSRCATCR
jgi:fumarate hydratase class I